MFIAPYDREDLRVQFRAARPFPWFAIDGFLEPRFADEVAVAYPPFKQAARVGHLFKAANENLKVQIVDPRAFPEPVQRLSESLASSRFREDLEYITGIRDLLWDESFTGGGMHETARSGWLDVHVDFNLNEQLGAHRRLNILLFLNPAWDERWGGLLELWDVDVKNCVHAFAPVHNRCIVFETSETSWHGVTAVSCPAGIARKSYAAYYYTRQPPTGWSGTSHTTVFRARPDEHLKRYVVNPLATTHSRVRGALRAVRKAVGLSRGEE